MAAINVIFVLLSSFIPVFSIILVIFLPLVSTIVTLFCKKKYYIIYAVATLGLCMLVTIWNISDSLFYVFPSLITGFLFGVGIEKRFPTIYLIVSSSLLQIGFSYLAIPIIELITGMNYLDTFIRLLGIQSYTYLYYLIPVIFMSIGLAQSTLNYGVINLALPKIGIEEKSEDLPQIFNFLIIIILNCLLALFVIIYPIITLLILAIIIPISVYETVKMIMGKNILKFVLICASLVATIFLFITTYNFIVVPLQFVTLSFYSICIGIIGFIH